MPLLTANVHMRLPRECRRVAATLRCSTDFKEGSHATSCDRQFLRRRSYQPLLKLLGLTWSTP